MNLDKIIQALELDYRALFGNGPEGKLQLFVCYFHTSKHTTSSWH